MALKKCHIILRYVIFNNVSQVLPNGCCTMIGLPPRYRDSVRAITPGLPLFLYNYTTHQLHGIFEVCYQAFILLTRYGFLYDALHYQECSRSDLCVHFWLACLFDSPSLNLVSVVSAFIVVKWQKCMLY